MGSLDQQPAGSATRTKASPSPAHHVVIVGAGFAGLSLAQTLGSTPLRVTVIDRRNYHLFQPLLYQVATAVLSPGEIAQPIRRILGRHKNITVLLGEVDDVNPKRKEVYINGEALTYDTLVLATGATHAIGLGLALGDGLAILGVLIPAALASGTSAALGWAAVGDIAYPLG